MKKYTIGWALMWAQHWISSATFNVLQFCGFAPVETIEKLSVRSEKQQASRRLTEDEFFLIEHAHQCGFEAVDDNADVLACTMHDLVTLVRKRYGGIEKVDDDNVKTMLNAMQRARDRKALTKSEHDMIMSAVWEKYERSKAVGMAQMAMTQTAVYKSARAEAYGATARFMRLLREARTLTENYIDDKGLHGADVAFGYTDGAFGIVAKEVPVLLSSMIIRRDASFSDVEWHFFADSLAKQFNGVTQ